MKKLPISSAGYVLLIEGFREWLDIQGYAEGTLEGLPRAIREFLHYLESEGCKRIDGLKSEHIRGYHARITSRANERTGGGLSSSYISHHVHALAKFLHYLHHRRVEGLPSLGIKPPKQERPPIVVLSVEEITELFKACDPQDGSEKEEAIRARDRAMLSVYYGCGLRRNEGVHVRVEDVDLDARTLRVRKGKGHKERLVPINKSGARHLAEWIHEHRPLLLRSESSDALFIGEHGRPLSGGQVYSRVKVIQQQVESAELRAKVIGLHTLRHAIATHLLHAGMDLQKIARFLGHSSMDSTQIYTHLSAEALMKVDPIEEAADGNVR